MNPYIIPRLELAMLVDVGVDVAVGAVSALDVRPEALDVKVHLPAVRCPSFSGVVRF